MPDSIVWQLPENRDEFRSFFFAGGVFAYPTETVWGIGGNPADVRAVSEIMRLKQRSVEKGLIMVAATWSQTIGWISGISRADQQAMQVFSEERPTTFIVSAGDKIADSLKDAETGRVAIRISKHPRVVQICACVQQPLISTSANIAGQMPADDLSAVMAYFPKLSVVSGTAGEQKRPSRLIDWHKQRVLRE